MPERSFAQDAFDEHELSSPRSPEQRGACFRSCLIGCGLVALLVLLVVGYLGYLFYINRDSLSQDPAQINAWLQEILPCKVPEGYETRFGMNLKLPGVHARFIMIFPPNIPLNEKSLVDQGVTTLIVAAPAPAANDVVRNLPPQLRIQLEGSIDGEENLKILEVSREEREVGGRRIEVTRKRLVPQGRKPIVVYELYPKDDVIGIAIGPEEGFDRKAFEAFLQSIE